MNTALLTAIAMATTINNTRQWKYSVKKSDKATKLKRKAKKEARRRNR